MYLYRVLWTSKKISSLLFSTTVASMNYLKADKLFSYVMHRTAPWGILWTPVKWYHGIVVGLEVVDVTPLSLKDVVLVEIVAS